MKICQVFCGNHRLNAMDSNFAFACQESDVKDNDVERRNSLDLLVVHIASSIGSNVNRLKILVVQPHKRSKYDPETRNYSA